MPFLLLMLSISARNLSITLCAIATYKECPPVHNGLAISIFLSKILISRPDPWHSYTLKMDNGSLVLLGVFFDVLDKLLRHPTQ